MNYKIKSIVLIQFAILALITLLSVLPATAHKERHGFLRVPVFFITDRNLLPAKSNSDIIQFGPHRKYIGDCKHEPFLGTAYCVVENIEGKPLSNDLKALGWTEAQAKDKEGNYKATLLPGDKFVNIEKDFFEKVHQKALLTPDKNIFVFAHGYKNSFASGLHTAAKLAYYAQRPLIFYSWPSVCAFRSYTSDEGNVEWSQEHYNRLVEQIDKLCTADPSIKMRLFAHSMGTRLVVRASPLLREKTWLTEASLVCPDIDDGLVKHYASRYLSANGTTTIRIYMSQHDKALAISQIIHGGYCRFGECADSLSGWALGALMPNQDNNSTANAEEDKKLAEVLERTKHRMQTIDFTNIDYGILGHKIPAELICSMSFTNGPCKGLKLIPEESGQRSGLSQKLSFLTKLGEKPELTVKGTCLRVVKADAPISKKLAKVLVQATPN